MRESAVLLISYQNCWLSQCCKLDDCNSLPLKDESARVRETEGGA